MPLLWCFGKLSSTVNLYRSTIHALPPLFKSSTTLFNNGDDEKLRRNTQPKILDPQKALSVYCRPKHLSITTKFKPITKSPATCLPTKSSLAFVAAAKPVARSRGVSCDAVLPWAPEKPGGAEQLLGYGLRSEVQGLGGLGWLRVRGKRTRSIKRRNAASLDQCCLLDDPSPLPHPCRALVVSLPFVMKASISLDSIRD